MTNDGITEKNKTQVKYKTSIPLQDHQSLVRSTNPETQKSGNGNSPRSGSRAPSEALDTQNEHDISPTGTHRQPDKASSPEENINAPNPQRRRAMEEEDGLEMEYQPTSRPVMPSPTDLPEGYGNNQTPKAKARYQPVNPFNCPEMVDKDIPDIEGPPDMQMSIEDECTFDHIRIKLEDILEELEAAKKTPIWDMLDTTDWAVEVMNLTGTTKKTSMDKHTIANLAETNVYLTKRIGELEHTNGDIETETIQLQRPTYNANPVPKPAQPTWAKVAASTHQKMPTQPAQTTHKAPQPVRAHPRPGAYATSGYLQSSDISTRGHSRGMSPC